jgi:RNA polymerase sigma-70 factor, ECF subfamily
METLQARLARGDPAAFAELYDAYADRLGHYLLVRLGTRDDAGDALQETFLRLVRMRRRFADVTNLEAYMFTVARNEAVRLAASAARRERKSPLVDDLFSYSPSDTEARENAAIVAAALEQLNPELREVVELKFYAELTFQQISRVTGTPQGTVATRYRTAMTKMQTWLTRQTK